MERSTKNRILGIVVMAALVIALLPLFHGSSSDAKPDSQVTVAPPFPDQSAQANDNANPEFKMALANQTSPIPFKNNGDSDSGINQLPDDTINPNTSKAYSNVNKPAPATTTPQPAVKQPAIHDLDDDSDIVGPATSNEDKAPGDKLDKQPTKAEATKNTPQDTETVFRNSLETELEPVAKPKAKKISHPVRVREVSASKMKQASRKTHLPLDDNGLFKLKNSAWVIQLGSYKNKTTALRLVNRLRANGYSAFIQQASAGTSVYVGPEAKEVAARSIAARLEYEMKLQGFVISYKPLTL